ncbi:hypothetical protein KA005_59150 [bacterium]|nr:hypothetical protein [bacterium]
MKKTIVILSILLFFVLCTKAQEFDSQPLQNEIAGLEQQIKDTRIESEKYTGGLIKVLLDSRIQILEYTKAMLEQRLAAGNYRVKINYTVEGKEYVPSANKDEILKNLENEALGIVQEMEIVQKEADQYSGGLIRVMKLSTVATYQQQLAMLEMKRCALIYDIPLFAFEEGSTAPAKSPTVPTEESLAEIDSMFEVKLTGKHVFEANYSDHLGFNLLLINHTEKDIKAVQGVLIFTDLFDAEILKIRITLEEDVPAGRTVKDNDHSIKLNKFKSEHQRLKTIGTKNLKMRLEVHGIIFKDGSTIKR